MNKNKKFPYFPKLKRKKDYKIISLFILLLFFLIIFLTQNKKQIKNEVSAKSKEVKILGATTIKKIKSSPTPTESTPASNAATPTPTSNDDDIIIRPSINPKTTIYPLPTNPIFPPEQ